MASKETRILMGVGGSVVVSLPRNWLNYYDVKIGDRVEVVTKNNTAIVTLIKNGEDKDNDMP